MDPGITWNHCIRKHGDMMISLDCSDGFNGWVQSVCFLRIVSSEKNILVWCSNLGSTRNFVSRVDLVTCCDPVVFVFIFDVLKAASKMSPSWSVGIIFPNSCYKHWRYRTLCQNLLDRSPWTSASRIWCCTFVLAFLISSRIKWKI